MPRPPQRLGTRQPSGLPRVALRSLTLSSSLAAGVVHEIGSLRFEGEGFTDWAKHSAFVEVYSTEKIPHSGIPKVNITFGWPRLTRPDSSF